MALPAAAIRAVISDALKGFVGENRRMPPHVFVRARFSTRTLEQKQLIANSLASPTRHAFDIVLTPVVDNAATSISSSSSSRIANIAVQIFILTPTPKGACECEVGFGKPQDNGITEAQDAAIDSEISDLDDAVQALSYPGNLTVTEAGRVTHIVSGMLLGPNGTGVPEYRITNQDWESMFIESRILARAIVTVTANP